MATFEVEIDDYDLRDAGWIPEGDIDYSDAVRAVEHYYFRNNLPKDNVYEDIIEILENL
jgi:hypothetical protein